MGIGYGEIVDWSLSRLSGACRAIGWFKLELRIESCNGALFYVSSSITMF